MRAAFPGIGARRDGPLLAAAAAGLALTVFFTVSPLVRYAYDNLSLHVALETAEGLIGALLAYLAVQRYRARGLTRDLLLAWTFSVLAATNLLLSAVPLVSLGERPVGTLTWAVAGMRLAGAAGLCTAAFVTVGGVPRRTRPGRAVVAGTGAVVVAVALWSLGAGAWLADAVDPSLSPESSGRPRIVGHPVVLGIQVVATVLYAAAASGFRRQARHVDVDALLPWLAAGAVLAAFARLNFFLFPSLYSNWVYTGDVLRLGSYLLFLVGAARQIDLYRRDQRRVAVFEERRRMARELHDGLAQELSFIRSQTAGGAAGMESPGMAGFVAAAADRALRESRRLIEALTETEDEPLAEALRAAAQEVAVRAGTCVELRAGTVVVAGDMRAELVRVVREAVGNAVRHGRAKKVVIRIGLEGRALRVTIADDGSGFDTRAPASGFGQQSMRERIAGIGGTFAVESAPTRGTVVRIDVPLRRRGA